MAIKVKIPGPLQKLTGDKPEVVCDNCKNINYIIVELEKQFPGIKDRLCENGKVRRFVNVYVNGEDIRFGNGVDTAVKDNDEVSFIPAIAGG